MLSRMTIGRKLGFGLALLLLLFVVSGVIMDWVVRDVSDRMTRLRTVEEPASEAAYEMEINTIGSGLSVLKYLETQDPYYKGKARDDQGDFERNKFVYDSKAESEEAREAGRRLDDIYQEYRELGDDLMDTKDGQEELFVRINSDFRRMDGLFDEKIQADLDRAEPDGAAKAELAAEMETDIAETGSSFGAYLREPVGTNRERIFDDADGFLEKLQRLRGLDLEPREEEYWTGQLAGQFEETVGRLEEAVAVDGRLRSDTERFSLLREQMDEVLDEDVQTSARRSLAETETAAVETVGGVRDALFGLLLVGLVVGSGAALVISRNIGASVRRLVEGAQKIGAGTLNHRIQVENEDEIGMLAVAFNEMAEKRQRAEEEIRGLNSELEARVEERTNDLTRVIAELGTSEERYRAVVEQTAECLFLFDAETKHILETNAAFQKLFGYSAGELTEMKIHDIVADAPTNVDAHVRRNREPGHHDLGERRYRHKDGSLIDVEVSGSPISYEGHERIVLGIARDITGRKKSEEEIRGAEARYRALVEQVPAALYTANFEDSPSLTYISPRYEELSGYGLEDHLADPALWSRTIHPEDRDWVLAEIRQVNLSGDPFEIEYRLVHRDGHVAWVQDASYVLKDSRGLPLHRQGFIIDVTERRELSEQLSHQALHDTLTGLPNRALFMDRLAHTLTGSERGGESLAVLLLDLDNFKMVNDSLGHREGDELLVEVARRLKRCLRPGDTAARIGGDEFCILLEDAAGEGEALRVVGRLREALATPIFVDGQELHVSTSVGIATSSGAAYRQGKGADALLRDADLAMYEAKSRGKDKHVVYDPSMNARARARLKKENDLRRAIERDELAVYYQPKVDLRTGSISGFEALVRWDSPERGLVPPGEFIALAEETDLIFPICRWVLEEACRQAKEWREEYSDGPPLSVAVNVSARQLQTEHGGIVEDVERALEETGLDPGSLHLEITESVLMEDVPQNLAMLARLKALGVRIKIDDFGTGYSSLKYLQRFPVDGLKIDRSFVDKLDNDEESAAIVEAMISFAHTLYLEVVAEGVETPAQLARLRSLGCDLGQGYHFSRPVGQRAATEILETVSSRR